ncbi:unnamed protein product [Paramecium pentaurelia]|uniref:EF-hand domain-containing protein n=1 Tax=Paramecium pentaurelia TaxID=43138 RepID=A0A8S1TTG5_9CILI|nr:unnamed protein product [Paramecium pentaurelia]
MNRPNSQTNEYFNLIEKCIQIPKDDRLYLRQCAYQNNPDIISIIFQYKKNNDQRRLYMNLRKFLQQNKQNRILQKKQQQQSKENLRNTSPQAKSKQQSRQNSIRNNNPRSLSKQLQCIHPSDKQQHLIMTTPHKQQQDRLSQNQKFHTNSGGGFFQEVQKFDETIKKSQNQKKWTEEEIVRKYADLFTAPDFLKKHRAISQDTDPDSKDFNFAITCQSFICQPKYYAMQKFSAEQIFGFIFTEASLDKISKTFFQYKMVAFYNEIDAEIPDLQEMFIFIDKKNDGFIDVNEMGQFLDFVCQKENRTNFMKLDSNNQGYFTEHQMLQQTRDRQLTRNYFQEYDIEQTGKITYWEYQLRKTTQLGQNLNKLLK